MGFFKVTLFSKNESFVAHLPSQKAKTIISPHIRHWAYLCRYQLVCFAVLCNQATSKKISAEAV